MVDSAVRLEAAVLNLLIALLGLIAASGVIVLTGAYPGGKWQPPTAWSPTVFILLAITVAGAGWQLIALYRHRPTFGSSQDNR